MTTIRRCKHGIPEDDECTACHIDSILLLGDGLKTIESRRYKKGEPYPKKILGDKTCRFCLNDFSDCLCELPENIE